jgi:hypothetical protein
VGIQPNSLAHQLLKMMLEGLRCGVDLIIVFAVGKGCKFVNILGDRARRDQCGSRLESGSSASPIVWLTTEGLVARRRQCRGPPTPVPAEARPMPAHEGLRPNNCDAAWTALAGGEEEPNQGSGVAQRMHPPFKREVEHRCCRRHVNRNPDQAAAPARPRTRVAREQAP